MRSHSQLIKRFYDEFPDTIGNVLFRHSQHLYPDVETEELQALKNTLKERGNAALKNTFQKSSQQLKNSCTIGLHSMPAFLNMFMATYNLDPTHPDTNKEQEFIFHHETYHAIFHFLTGVTSSSSNFKSTFLEECEADAYATIRLILDYGEDALSFLKHVANQRIIDCHDAEHLSTFSIDAAINIGLKIHQIQQQPDPFTCIGIAQQIAQNDRLFDVVDNKSLYRIPNIANFIKAISVSISAERNSKHPEWLMGRYKTALIEQELTAVQALKHHQDCTQAKPLERKPMFRR